MDWNWWTAFKFWVLFIVLSDKLNKQLNIHCSLEEDPKKNHTVFLSGKVTGWSAPLVVDYSGALIKYEFIADDLYELQLSIIFKVYACFLYWFL